MTTSSPPIPDHCRNYLPHIECKSLQSITFRLYDSLPQEVVAQWKSLLCDSDETPETALLRARIEQYEDAGYGQCFLRDPRVAEVVQEALRYGDGVKYRLLCWCIMPNHVHVLIEVLPGYTLSDIMKAWKSITARRANVILGRKGSFWMREYYDRYIRNAEHLHTVVEYIDYNPVRAGLSDTPTHYPYSSAHIQAKKQ